MPRHRPLLSLALLLAFASCAAPANTPPPPAADPAALRATIEAREKEWSAAFLARNAAGVAALYSEDGAQVQASGDAYKGRDAITKAMQAQFDTIDVTSREDITEEIIPAGEYIVEIGHYSFQGTSRTDKAKAPRSGAGRYMVLWRKDADGVWRLLRDIGSEAPPKKS